MITKMFQNIPAPYRVGQFVTKNGAYFCLKFVKSTYIQGFASLMTLWDVSQLSETFMVQNWA